MKLKKVKRGLINITDQSVNMGIIFIVTGIVAAVGYTVYSKFWAVNETNVISNIINEVRNMEKVMVAMEQPIITKPLSTQKLFQVR